MLPIRVYSHYYLNEDSSWVFMFLDHMKMIEDSGLMDNLDVIKCADWVIDMGPEGGSGGGLIVAEGTPEEVAKNKKSYTGQFLAEVLK